MAPRIFPLAKLVVKGALAGGAVYVVYDQGLLRGSEEGARALQKAQEALPPAVEEWVKYFGWEIRERNLSEMSLRDPAFYRFHVHLLSTGVRTAIGALSVAPTRATEYTHDGWKYVKNLTK
ncbi:hypothetical protein JRQ81_008997 [Phrynocephalus forsythii]|uniref:MICOS complex subunit MIC13 n=1 Tax=Phrynocephalus forsythii TaxID=171643 RepID=A0A9Q0XEF4_9SAUR|nr:hypothetical protein JRQ81_008997 [Phrynocephalus forsythii]